MSVYKTAAVLACAGNGSRMGQSCPDKLLLKVCGLPVAAHTLRAYDQTEGVDLLVIVTQAELVPVYQAFKTEYGLQKELLVTVGGTTRMESVLKGVSAVPEEYELVVIGDGARPLIRSGDIQKTIECARERGAAALGVHLTDTVKEVQGDQIVKTVPREVLVGIQTPQVFHRSEYMELATKAAQTGKSFTDDASIFEYFGKPVALVEGHRDNIKITVPEDVAVFRAMMEEQK